MSDNQYGLAVVLETDCTLKYQRPVYEFDSVIAILHPQPPLNRKVKFGCHLQIDSEIVKVKGMVYYRDHIDLTVERGVHETVIPGCH